MYSEKEGNSQTEKHQQQKTHSENESFEESYQKQSNTPPEKIKCRNRSLEEQKVKVGQLTL